jgi:hypothetical protein
MKLYFVQAGLDEYRRISGFYGSEGFKESYLFHGVGSLRHVAFYVTHGSPIGYFVMDCSGERQATYSNKDFAFYMMGLFMDNKAFSDVDTVVTCECYGGFHVPSKLPLGDRTIIMKPLSDQKTVLWAGWRISQLGYPYFCAVIMTPSEIDQVSNNQTGFASASPVTDKRVAKFESVSYSNQLNFVIKTIDAGLRKIKDGIETDSFEMEAK